MKNQENLVALFSFTAAMLFISSIVVYFAGTISAIAPAVTALIGLLLILDVVLIYLLATQSEVDGQVVYGLLLFIGFSVLLVQLWMSPASIISAGLALGYALVFILGVGVVIVHAVAHPQYVERSQGRPSARWSQIVGAMRGQQAQMENVERKVEQVRQDELMAKTQIAAQLRRNAQESRIVEELDKQDIKSELGRKVEQVRFDELQTKHELKQEIQDVLLEEQQSKQEIKRELRNVEQQVKDAKKDITREVKKALKEETFFIASKTGKSLHKKSCIVLENIPKKNRITFENEKFAFKQGYKLCRVCNPVK